MEIASQQIPSSIISSELSVHVKTKKELWWFICVACMIFFRILFKIVDFTL